MKPWFTMKAVADGEGEILIYDQIGEGFFGDGLSAKAFDAELKKLGDLKSLNVRINSPGGSVFDGLAIYNTLKAHPARKTVSVDGIAASAASLIAMAGDSIVMPDNAFMLIHEPRAMAMGTSSDMLALAADLEKMTDSFASIYANRSGSTPEAAKALMAEDRLMTAAEAKQSGYADEVGGTVRMTAAYDLSLLPDEAQKAVSDAIAARGAIQEAAEKEAADKAAADAAAEEARAKALSDAVESASAAARNELTEIIALCNSQSIPEKALEFVVAKTPIAEVREKIAAIKASRADAQVTVTTQPQAATDSRMESWRKTQEKTRAEMGLGARK